MPFAAILGTYLKSMVTTSIHRRRSTSKTSKRFWFRGAGPGPGRVKNSPKTGDTSIKSQHKEMVPVTKDVAMEDADDELNKKRSAKESDQPPATIPTTNDQTVAPS